MRRDLNFDCLTEATHECERLLRSGYVKNGNWSLGQICFHMRTSIEANMQGYPRWMTVLGFPLRPFLRKFVLPQILAGRSAAGIKTAPQFVPPGDLDDASEVNAFKQCVQEFLKHKEPLHAHPGFGNMDHAAFNRFHASHAAHHLSFLSNETSDETKV